VLVLLAGCNDERNQFVAPPPPSVRVAVPLQKSVTPYIELTGTAEAYASVNLLARVEGYLQQINYVDGETAKAGDLLFVIEPAPYQAQLKEAEAAVAAARADSIESESQFQRQFGLLQEQVSTPAIVDKLCAKRDANARRSLGVSTFSGMVASTCLAVLFVPSFFVVMQRLEERRRTKRTAAAAAGEAAPVRS
jgi:multidrug efflux pump subunit AcrA (membrane-fusion protein)